jgi:hypothetical protein
VATVALGLARAARTPDISRVGSRQVRTTNARLQKEIRASVKERHRLTEEVLGHGRRPRNGRSHSRVEEDLAKTEAELERLRARGVFDRP